LRFINKATRISAFFLLSVILIQCIGIEKDSGTREINNTYSAIYDISSSKWTGDVNGYNQYINVPEINEDIYYNGAVLVYRLFENAPKSFNMLPYTYTDNLLTVNMDFDVYIGNINLTYKEVYNGVNDTPIPDDMSFKVVIIEGVPLAVLKGMVDINNYDAVAKMLNFKDPIRKTVQF
jgi:hypothetical protein